MELSGIYKVAQQAQIETYEGINASPREPTQERAGNASHTIAQHNAGMEALGELIQQVITLQEQLQVLGEGQRVEEEAQERVQLIPLMESGVCTLSSGPGEERWVITSSCGWRKL